MYQRLVLVVPRTPTSEETRLNPHFTGLSTTFESGNWLSGDYGIDEWNAPI